MELCAWYWGFLSLHKLQEELQHTYRIFPVEKNLKVRIRQAPLGQTLKIYKLLHSIVSD